MKAKKFLSLLMSLAMILTALPLSGVTAFAEDGTHTSGDFEYVVLEDGTAEITGYVGNSEVLDIPSKLDTYTVISIGNDAFADCDGLTSVTIPDSVTSIGDNAFSDCDGLTSITIPNGVKNIGEMAFMSCDYLASITIPESVTSIGEGAFDFCKSLTEINVDTNNKNYSSQDGVLFNKNKTELIQYPIGNERKSYNIPDSVTSIGDSAFEDCESLTSVSIPDSVTSIGLSAFDDCFYLTKITIPNSVTSIGWGAFANCDGLTSITIPNGVKNIGEMVFMSCDHLASITIPESVTSIGEGAFYCCYILTDIYILNKDCNIASSEDYYTIPTETTIHGYAGSTAESYAEEHGNKFVEICDHLNIEKVPAKAATCTEDGNIEYYHCSDCNKNFKDINGNEEITDVVVKAAHKMGEKVEAKAATCTEDGNVEYYHCSACNKNFKDIDGNEEITDVVVKATGHKFENGVCTVCGEKQNAIGDVDGNKNITITDAKWILQNTVKSRTFTEAQAKAADLNKDGKITIVDAKWVLQIVVGLRDAKTLKPIKK